MERYGRLPEMETWPNRRPSQLGAQPAWFVGREDFLRNKSTIGRDIDLHDAGLPE
jgi:hypothetical protein